METKIVIAGSRYFTDYNYFSSALDRYFAFLRAQGVEEILILSGHCVGVDMMAERYAEEHGYNVKCFPADWKTFGRSAGPRRNAQMVAEADYAVAFPSGGAGTRSLISLAQKKGIPVKIYPV